MHLDQYIELLGKLNFTDFIVLHRSNYLRRVISVCVGFKNDSWQSEKEITDPTKITIEVNAYKTAVGRLPLLELFACLDHAYNQLKQILPERSTLCLSYEDDIIDDPGIAYRKTCSFLNIADESPNVNLSRTKPFQYGEMLYNYDEVKNTLSGTKYEWMLDE